MFDINNIYLQDIQEQINKSNTIQLTSQNKYNLNLDPYINKDSFVFEITRTLHDYGQPVGFWLAMYQEGMKSHVDIIACNQNNITRSKEFVFILTLGDDGTKRFSIGDRTFNCLSGSFCAMTGLGSHQPHSVEDNGTCISLIWRLKIHAHISVVIGDICNNIQ